MPFGKYAGLPVADIPEQYLLWLCRTVSMSANLERAVYEALDMEPPQRERYDDKLSQCIRGYEDQMKDHGIA